MALLDLIKKKLQGKQQLNLSDYELPTFPTSILNLLAKLRDPDATIHDLAAELEVDPGLHVRVLKTVNSVAFGLTRKVGNVHHAVTLLGRSRLEALVLSVAIKDGISHSRVPDDFDLQRFWHTAALRASVSRGLETQLRPGNEAESFTAGLLQDMGVPVLAGLLPGYHSLYQQWLDSGAEQDLIDLERQQFNTDHAAIGSLIAQQWELPAFLVESIANHHGERDHSDVSLAIQVAATIKNAPDKESTGKLADQLQQRFGLDLNMVHTVLETAIDDAGELAMALS